MVRFPVQAGVLFSKAREKRPRHDADHPSPCNVEVKNELSSTVLTPLPPLTSWRAQGQFYIVGNLLPN